MSSSKGLIRNILLSLTFTGSAIALSGCGLTPLYGDSSLTRQSMALSYAEPTSRLEQIVYQELGRSFAPSASADAPLVSVSVSRSGRGVTRTSNPGSTTNYEMVVTGTILIVGPEPEKKVILNVTRQASASYTTTGQVLADNSADIEASERGARALAETLRLTVLATLANSPQIR